MISSMGSVTRADCSSSKGGGRVSACGAWGECRRVQCVPSASGRAGAGGAAATTPRSPARGGAANNISLRRAAPRPIRHRPTCAALALQLPPDRYGTVTCLDALWRHFSFWMALRRVLLTSYSVFMLRLWRHHLTGGNLAMQSEGVHIGKAIGLTWNLFD